MGSIIAALLGAIIVNIAAASPAPASPTFASGSGTLVSVSRPASFSPISINGNATGAGDPVLNSFVSFSLEFAFFPDFAGNESNPNTFSDNLLNNLGDFQGSKPDIRVGGNTQDYALYDPDLKVATNGTIIPSISTDYPRILSIGPSFFESYNIWPGVKFVHGFNLGKNGSEGATTLANEAPVACKALSNGNFAYWEMGNEPDLFKTSAQGIVRPASWDEKAYVAEWLNKTGTAVDLITKSCGNSSLARQWIAPSFAGTSNSLDAVKTWNAGLGSTGLVKKFSSHNYIGGATQPGVTLAGYLLNHTRTVASVGNHNKEQANLKAAGMTIDYILGETNSLYNEGASGLSNSFGAALWGVDFNLYCAATNIKQTFMHQGTDYRYASWQPVTTNKTVKGTKAPYYGNVAVAAALGDITNSTVRVQNIPLVHNGTTAKETEAAYAIYAGEKLKRLMIINLQQYNYSVPTPITRESVAYNFTLPTSCSGHGIVQRLIANGSDAITGVTFNGVSYNYELANGQPQLLGNVTKDEIVWVGQDGGVSVDVPWSSAALVQLTC